MRTEKLQEDLLSKLIEQNMQIASKIRTNQAGPTNRAYAFIITVLKILHPSISENDLGAIITDGYEDGSMDVIYIPYKKSEYIEIYDVKSGSKGFSYNDVSQFLRDIDDYIFGNEEIQSLNTYAKKQIKKVKQLNNPKFKFYICRESLKNPNDKIRNLCKSKLRYANAEKVILLSGSDFVRIKTSQTENAIDYKWKVNVIDKPILDKDKNNNIKTLVARIPLYDIINLEFKYKKSGFNLFEKNVRQFLNKSTASIPVLKTLKKFSSQFYLFHNGLVLVGDNINALGKYKFEIMNPQIINGCQTVNMLSQALLKNKINKASLQKADVICKVHATTDTKLIGGLCQTSNTQEKIGMDDLRANDYVQKIIEFLYDKNYGRRRPYRGYKITMPKLAQWIYSCKYGEPAAAKNKKASIFDVLNETIYDKVFGNNISFSDIKQIAKIALFVNKKLKDTAQKNKYKFLRDADLHIIASIYYLETQRGMLNLEKEYNKALVAIKKAIKTQRVTNGKDYDFNKIFTKDGRTWGIVKANL